jgi:hypothetical protein
VDAVSCELFSDPNSLLTGKFTGNILLLAEAFRDKSPSESALAGKTEFSRPIGTGNDQGMNREWNSLIVSFVAEFRRSFQFRAFFQSGRVALSAPRTGRSAGNILIA